MTAQVFNPYAAHRHSIGANPIRRRVRVPEWVILLPIMVCLLGFYLAPIGFSIWGGFQAEGTLMSGGQYVGAEHYASLLRDSRFHGSLRVTVVFTVSTVLATYLCGLAAALLLNRRFRGSSFVGSALLIPWTMPLVVVAVVWGWLLDYQFGAVNYVLERSGLANRQIGFLTDPEVAIWSVGIAQVWRLFPLAMVTLLAALKAIPPDLYEAAVIDGASSRQTFRYITLPAIRATTVALVLLLGIWAFGRAFTIIFVLTGGGPAGATETLVVQTFLEGFRNFRLERASAMGTVILVLSIAFTALYLRANRDRND
ncbi:MAG: sugar ABC transporter permease [Alphaproteobacteria bacterium]|nr:sugar ABC transporter permease [Alphaproteobacteria bacterium]